MLTSPLTLKNESWLIAHVPGQYRPPSASAGFSASLGLYLNTDLKKNPYSFCYHDNKSELRGQKSPYQKDEPVEKTVLDAWYDYAVLPHFWQLCLCSEVENLITDPALQTEYVNRWHRFSEIVQDFQRKEAIRAMVHTSNPRKVEDRLFYPTPPPRSSLPSVVL
jgi:hypothetical protein